MIFAFYFGIPFIAGNWLLGFHLPRVHAFYGKTWFDQAEAEAGINRALHLTWIIIFNVVGVILGLCAAPSAWLGATLIYLALGMAISQMDFSYHVIPDRFQITGLLTALAELGINFRSDQALPFGELILNLAFFAILFSSGWIYQKIRKRDGIGMGDIKLLFWMALALPQGFVPAFFIGILSGLLSQLGKNLIRRQLNHSDPFALGPWLILGFLTMKLSEPFW